MPELAQALDEIANTPGLDAAGLMAQVKRDLLVKKDPWQIAAEIRRILELRRGGG